MAPRNAAIVDAWLAEGAVILGTTNVPRMLIDIQTAGEIYPEAHNPYDVKKEHQGKYRRWCRSRCFCFLSTEFGW